MSAEKGWNSGPVVEVTVTLKHLHPNPAAPEDFTLVFELHEPEVKPFFQSLHEAAANLRTGPTKLG